MCVHSPLQKETQKQSQPIYEAPVQEEAQHQLNAAPVQVTAEAVQAEPEHITAGEAMARAMMSQLPAAGQAASPIAPPAPLDQQEAAPKCKKERKRRKRQQEEALRRQEEAALEQERLRDEQLRLEREEQAQAKEAKRQQRRTLLFSDAHVRTLLADYVQETDAQKAQEKAEAFLRAANQKLLESDQELAQRKQALEAEEDISQTATSFQLLISTQMEDEETAGVLLDEAQEHRTRLTSLAEEHALLSLTQQELADVLREEFSVSSDLAQAVTQMSDTYQQKNSAQHQEWEAFQSGVLEKLHLRGNQHLNATNLFAPESPFHYLSKPATVTDFQEKIAQRMQDVSGLTREEAQRQVFAEHRAALSAEALRRTRMAGVLSDQVVSAEDWQSYGGASYHYILPAAQANQAVENSNGFLYAKKAGDGLCELRPTLPEIVQVEGKDIPLRRSYTLLIKTMTHLVLSEDGRLRESAAAITGELALINSPDTFSDAEKILKPALIEVLEGNEEEATRTLEHLNLLVQHSSMQSFPPKEILNNFGDAINRLNMDRLMEREVLLRQELLRREEAANHSPEERNQALETFSLAFSSICADVDQSYRELMEIRNMSLDSQEVPLPNACSAHGNMIAGIRHDYMNASAEDSDMLWFRTSKHILSNPLSHVEYCLSHLDDIPFEFFRISKEEVSDRLNQIGRSIKDANEQQLPFMLSDKDWIFLRTLTVEQLESPSKYAYHVAANLGQIPGGPHLTSEGFAAETKQFVVSPFSCHHAVGLYRGDIGRQEYGPDPELVSDGMVAYYLHDNPLPSDYENFLLQMKRALAGGKPL